MKLKGNICLLILVMSFALTSCNHDENNDVLQNGDLLFIGLPWQYSISDSAGMSSAIISSTGDTDKVNYVHVAILEVSADSTWIIDATLKRGVARYPLDTFLRDFTLKDGTYPQFDVKRLKNNKNASAYVEQAKKYIGRCYDVYFLPDNEEQYCSELVYNSYVSFGGSHLFHQYPMNFKSSDGSFPVYWEELFAILGQPIPQNKPGTNPNSMAQENCLKNVNANIVRQ